MTSDMRFCFFTVWSGVFSSNSRTSVRSSKKSSGSWRRTRSPARSMAISVDSWPSRWREPELRRSRISGSTLSSPSRVFSAMKISSPSHWRGSSRKTLHYPSPGLFGSLDRIPAHRGVSCSTVFRNSSRPSFKRVSRAIWRWFGPQSFETRPFPELSPCQPLASPEY